MYGEEEMERVEKEIKECRHCELCKTRNNPVVGEGSLSAKVMFVGEAPGYYEDLKGRPFVGKAGKVLDELLESVGLQRNEVYITNVLKCRPPGNRNPATAEIKACTPYLDAQLEIIKPEVIATLGNFSLSYIFDKFGLKKDKISKMHGKVFDVSTIASIKKIIPLYHPAVATYNPGMKEVLVEDFKMLFFTLAINTNTNQQQIIFL
ncbi:MAG: uracil-DNA glycosylase [Candidatus Syntrophoarchaeum sp.]|nr:uracil-DNA glycosylase [Methanomicrobia archaeon]MBL7117411.1 uracil-DNA glycosylase [Candidatus Syntrophoarchaeum sp.]